MPWSTIEIDGTPADCFEPSQADSDRVLLHLHGHGLRTLKDDPVYTPLLEKHSLRTICPHGGRGWWLDTLCLEFDSEVTPLAFLRESVVPWIEQTWDVAPPRIGLSGICMGGQGVLQLAYRRPLEFPVVVGICPVVDFTTWYEHPIPLNEMFEDAESARQQIATLQILPLHWPKHQLLLCDPDDPNFDGVQTLASKLVSSGIPYERDLETRAGGHSWDYCHAVAGRAIEFIAERL